MLLKKERRKRGKVLRTTETGIRITAAVKSGSNITLTFDQAVIVTDKPQCTLTGASGLTLTTAVASSPNTVVLTFSGAVTAATAINFTKYQDLGIRNSTGGYVADSTFPLT